MSLPQSLELDRELRADGGRAAAATDSCAGTFHAYIRTVTLVAMALFAAGQAQIAAPLLFFGAEEIGRAAKLLDQAAAATAGSR